MKTQDDLFNALREFATVSINIVGLDATTEMIEYATQIVSSDPNTYRKLSSPKAIEELKGMATKFPKGQKPGPMDIMSMYGTITKLLK